jgi:[acyl-carrier-protein] S-malonyltransferase
VLEKKQDKVLAELCSYVAGHSLGEYTALCAAGAISLSDTARLLRIRGNAMQEAVAPGQGGMAALIGVDFAQADALAKAAAQGEVCQAANDNGGGQVVVSGSLGAIERVLTLAQEHGVKRAVKLPVSAPFHCALMQPAADAMQEALAAVEVKAPLVPLVANITATTVEDANEIRQLLVQQVTGMVRWRESVERLKHLGVTRLLEVGAGKVLSGLTKRIDGDLQSVSVQTPQDIDAFLLASV